MGIPEPLTIKQKLEAFLHSAKLDMEKFKRKDQQITNLKAELETEHRNYAEGVIA